MKFFLPLFLVITAALGARPVRPDDIEIVVIVCSYNNEKYVKDNLRSLVKQDYPKWQMIYFNDASTDKTGEEVEKFVHANKMGDRSLIIHNKERKGGMYNTYHAINALNPRKVVVQLDGDDMLKGKKAFSRIAKIYRNKKIWMSYGNYESYPQSAPGWTNDPCYAFPDEVLKNRSFRHYTWIAYPLRTFYAKLFQYIKEEDLKYKGHFYPVVWDAGIMFPMLEMAQEGHIHYENSVLYIYRVNTGINDFFLRKPLMEEISKHIRALPKYPPLKKLLQ